MAFKRATSVIHSWFEQSALKKRSIRWKKCIFCLILTVFPPFLSQKSESLMLLFAQSLFFKDQRDRLALVALCKRAIMSESLPSLFEKESLWANRSRQSLKKSNGAIRSFSWANYVLFCSLDHKKLAIRSKSRLSNLQPWPRPILLSWKLGALYCCWQSWARDNSVTTMWPCFQGTKLFAIVSLLYLLLLPHLQ